MNSSKRFIPLSVGPTISGTRRVTPRITRQPAIEKDLPPVTHGLFATWRDLVAIREQLKSDPDYRYVPEVPGQDAIPVSSDNSG